ncbi:hypothetical protein ACNOYE_22520 [Nannocystaceae bacterium ST9]
MHDALPRRTSNQLPQGLSPLCAARWLITKHLDYLRGVEGPDHAAWRRSLPVDERERVLALGRALVWTWIERVSGQLGPLVDVEPRAWLERAANLVRPMLLTPFELRMSLDRQWYADAEARHFEFGTASRLLRGYVNCDAHAQLLGLILARWTRVELIGVVSHRLLRLPELGPAYVDVYADLPAFTIDAGSSGLPSHADTLAAAELRDARALACGRIPGEPVQVAANYQAANCIRELEHAPACSWPRHLAAPEPTPASLPSDFVSRYFAARVLALFGRADRALTIFRALATGDDRPGVVGSYRRAARHLAGVLANSPR